jgi:hypothetical protein
MACSGCAPTASESEIPSPRAETSAEVAEPINVLEPTPTPGSPALKTRIEAAIDQVRQRDLLLTNGFWTVFHGILGLGPGLTLKHPDAALRVNAVDYIAQGGTLRGMRFIPTEYGVDVETGEMFVSQGHQDQFVAEMAECGVPGDKEFVVRGKKYRFVDFARHSQMRAQVTSDQELSWTIIAVGQYLGTDLSWTNSAGEKLTYEDLVRYEQKADVLQAACGGTHRLFGLKWAYNLHLRNGGKTVGVWKDLIDEQLKFQQLARKYQNADGSFSTDFFRGPGNAPEMQLRMNTTGHILEWLAYSLPDSELHKEWIERAANKLALMFWEIKDDPMESGTLYHAAHGLRIYHQRVFGHDSSEPQTFLVLPPAKQSG